ALAGVMRMAGVMALAGVMRMAVAGVVAVALVMRLAVAVALVPWALVVSGVHGECAFLRSGLAAPGRGPARARLK
ncbi:MAG TPA: hypothetical protein VN840_18225, partial [Streptosporangiaceae bacterium]|nr:hypothetical protein [Streptosporangiaceae bacterium]